MTQTKEGELCLVESTAHYDAEAAFAKCGMQTATLGHGMVTSDLMVPMVRNFAKTLNACYVPFEPSLLFHEGSFSYHISC